MGPSLRNAPVNLGLYSVLVLVRANHACLGETCDVTAYRAICGCCVAACKVVTAKLVSIKVRSGHGDVICRALVKLLSRAGP